MKLEEYFKQTEYYFSESERQLVPLDSMPFPRLYYSQMKLLKEYGDEFIKTPLQTRMLDLLMPSPTEIRRQMQVYGKACHMYANVNTYPRTFESSVRSKLMRALKGKRVTTKKHADKHAKGLGWIEAIEDSAVNIRVKSHRGT